MLNTTNKVHMCTKEEQEFGKNNYVEIGLDKRDIVQYPCILFPI